MHKGTINKGTIYIFKPGHCGIYTILSEFLETWEKVALAQTCHKFKHACDLIYIYNLIHRSITETAKYSNLRDILFQTNVHDMDILSLLPSFNTLREINFICKISNEALQMLSSFTNLQNISFSTDQIINITPISELPNLTSLDIKIDATSMHLLPNFNKLKNLELYGSSIMRDFSMLYTLTTLQTLYISMHHLTDCSPLSNMVNLTDLNLSSNRIVDCFSLSKLTKLRTLNLDENNIIDCSPLSSLINLEKLTINCNHIVDVSPLSTLIKLRHLDLENNDIKDCSPLVHLIHLKFLNVDINLITDLTPLDALTDTYIYS